MTSNKNDKINGIIESYKQGKLSEDDRKYLNVWLTNKANKEIFDESLQVGSVNNMESASEPDLAGIFDKVNAALDSEAYRPARPRFLWNRMLIAASVLLITAIGGILIWINQGGNDETYTPDTTQSGKDDILPGADRATLTMADGKVMDLAKIADGSVVNQENTVITKAGGLLSYSVSMAQTNEDVSYHTLSTPRGGQFKLILPDGSKAWLNAASSIYFPSRFAGESRKVEVTGEVYFDVQKNAAVPFIVSVKEQETIVLGTEFNINAYDINIRTTLLKGSVRVSSSRNSLQSVSKLNASLILKPGEQSVSNINSLVLNRNANLKEVVAWKEGSFYFNGATIFEIMPQLARWYDIEYEIDNGVTNHELVGKISRLSKVSEVLKILQKTEGFNYKIEKNKVIILP